MSSSQITPMKRFKNHFAKLESLFSQYEYIHGPISLNKVDSKYQRYSFYDSSKSRGVESDHIRIYEDRTQIVDTKSVDYYRTRNVYRSIAFVFNYIDVEIPTVQFTKKTVDGIVSSNTMFMEEFRSYFNKLNKDLQDANFTNINELFCFIEDIFMKQIQDPDIEVNKALEEIRNETLLKNDVIDTESIKIDQFKGLLENREKVIKLTLEANEDYQEIQELKDKLKKLEARHNLKKAKLEKEYNIKEIKDNISKSSRKKREAEIYRDRLSLEVARKYPKHIKEIVIKRLDYL